MRLRSDLRDQPPQERENAIILAHNYMTPDIFHGVADLVGDSLALARMAAKSDADIICQATVLFMAETSKILCPDKIVLQPDMDAGCTLADAITPEDIVLRKEFPGVPIVAYVNTSAAVKAEVDVCCTSANVIEIVNAIEGDEVVLVPDMYLAQYVASHTRKKVHMCGREAAWFTNALPARTCVNTGRKNEGVAIIAHPECPQDVLAESDYTDRQPR